MKQLLMVLSIIAFVLGLSIYMAAQSAIHEIEAFVLFLIGTVSLSSMGVIEAIHQLQSKLIIADKDNKY